MSIKDDIDALEKKLARLKAAYEQYFMRIERREPARLRDEVDRLVLAYSNRQINNTALRFRYNALVSRYNSYKQYWTRTLRAIEEGTYWKSLAEDAGPSGKAAAQTKKARTAGEGPGGNGTGAEELKKVYEQYMEARRSCNEPVEGLTFEKLSQTIDKCKKQVEEKYHVKDVDLKVYVKDGKTRLAITPKVKKGAGE